MSCEDGSDVILSLMSIPYKINSVEIRQQIIQKGRPLPVVLHTGESSKSIDLKFNSSWYEVHPWLCGSVRLNKLFCWPCLLMRPESSSWSSTGVDDLKRISALTTKHSSCKAHLKAIMEYDAALVEVGQLPVFSNEESSNQCKEKDSDSDSDYLGKYLAPKRTNAPSNKEATANNFSQHTTLTFRAWQQLNRSLLENKDSKLVKRKRRLARLKIKNAKLEGQKLGLEIQLLQAKLEYQRSISQDISVSHLGEQTTEN